MTPPARIADNQFAAYRASFTLTRSEAESARVRVSGLAYSGGLVPKHGFFGDHAIDVASLTVPERVNLLSGHDHARVVGSAAVILRDNAVWIEGEISEATEAGREIAATLEEGVIEWQLSVGLQGRLQFFEPKAPVTVNGQTLELDSLLVDGLLREVSFVAVGADPATHVQMLAARYGAAHPSMNPTKGDPVDHETARAEIARLTAELEALRASNETLTRELATIRSEQRAREIVAMFSSALGRKPTEDELRGYGAMPDEAFATVRATFSAIRPPRADLLAETVRSGAEDEADPTGEKAGLARMRAKYAAQKGAH